MRPNHSLTRLPTPAQLAIIAPLVRCAQREANGRDGPFVAVGTCDSDGRWNWQPAPTAVAANLTNRREVQLSSECDALGMVSGGVTHTDTTSAARPAVVAWACLRTDAHSADTATGHDSATRLHAVSLVLFGDDTAIWSASPEGVLPTLAAGALHAQDVRQPAGGRFAATPVENAAASSSRDG